MRVVKIPTVPESSRDDASDTCYLLAGGYRIRSVPVPLLGHVPPLVTQVEDVQAPRNQAPLPNSDMTTRSEREKAQKQNEQHQAILSQLLRETDNKYCADCEAKGGSRLRFGHITSGREGDRVRLKAVDGVQMVLIHPA